MNRILFPASELNEDQSVRFQGEILTHLRKVLRSKRGDTVRGGVINGACCECEVAEITSEFAELHCRSWHDADRTLPLHVALAVPRPRMMNRLWSLLSSMGVARFDLIKARHTDPAYIDSHVLDPETAERQMLDGLQQAANLTSMPEWKLWESVDQYLAEASTGTEMSRLLFEPGENAEPIPQSLDGGVLAIGPERGWTEREINAFCEAGFQRTGLGREIYRTEVACIAAVAIAKDRLQVPS